MSGNDVRPALVPSHEAFVPTFIPLRTPIAMSSSAGAQAAGPACVVPFAIPLQRPAMVSDVSMPSTSPAAVVSGDVATPASLPSSSFGTSTERRYGGAIVRISDLVGRGASAGSSATAYTPASARHTEGQAERYSGPDTTTRATSRTVSHRDTMMSSPATTMTTWSGVLSDGQAAGCDTSYDPMPTLTARRGRGARQQRQGSRQAGVRRRVTRGRHVGRRGRTRRGARDVADDIGNVDLQQPDGAFYEHRWVTVRGRRQLIYNGRTYKGRSAHAMWRRLKTAGQRSCRDRDVVGRPSSPPSLSRGPREVGTAGFRSATELYHNITLEQGNTSGAVDKGISSATPRAVPPSTRLPTKQPLRPTPLQLLHLASGIVGVSGTSTKPPPAAAAAPPAAVILLDSEEEDDTQVTKCATATAAQQKSCRAEVTMPDYFATDEDETSDSISTGSLNDKDSFTDDSVSVDDAPRPVSVTGGGQDVVEHDGWVYPAEVYAEMMRASQTARGAATRSTTRGRSAPNGVVAEDDIPLATLYGAAATWSSSTAVRGAPTAAARGMQIIGHVPELPQRAPALVSAAPPPSAYYDDDADVFDGLAAQEAEGLFEVAEELGGVRYQGV